MPENVVATIPSNGVETYRMSTDAANICGAIVKATAQNIQGRRYVKVEGWQAIAIAHGCAATSCNVERIEGGVRATGQVRRMDNGIVIAEAEGFVGEDEPVWYGGKLGNKVLPKRSDFAIRAMAQTRAISRACRSAFAHVVVMIDKDLSTTPAEEMYGAVYENEPAREPTGRKPTNDWVADATADGIVDTTRRKGEVPKTQGPWDMVECTLETAKDWTDARIQYLNSSTEIDKVKEFPANYRATLKWLIANVPEQYKRLNIAYGNASEATLKSSPASGTLEAAKPDEAGQRAVSPDPGGGHRHSGNRIVPEPPEAAAAPAPPHNAVTGEVLPPEHARLGERLAFTDFTSMAAFADWAEPFLDHTNDEGAKQFLAFYSEMLAAMDTSKNKNTREMVSWLRAKAQELIDPPTSRQ